MNIFFSQIVRFSVVVFCAFLAVVLLDTAIVFSQTSSFLSTPYYKSHSVGQGWSSTFNPTHHAYDYNLVYEPVVAASTGIVNISTWSSDICHTYTGTDTTIGLACGFGMHIRINHTNGYGTIYGHLSTAINDVGITLNGGEILGTSGHTGWSTGPHLHFETRNNNNVKVDPNANPILWQDGELANPTRPIPEPASGGEIVVDDNTNNTNGFSKGYGGTFNNLCQNDCNGQWTRNSDMYWTTVNGTTVNRWARWTPNGIQPGAGVNGGAIYEVFVYVKNVNSTSWKAPFYVTHYYGTTKVTTLP